MSKRRVNKKKRVESFDFVAYRLIKSKNRIFDIGKIKSGYSREFIDDSLLRLSSIEKLKEFILGGTVIDKYEDFYSHDILGATNIDRELLWLSNILLGFKDEIQFFVNCRDNYYRFVLMSNSDACFATLDEVEASLGKSEWLIQNRIACHGQFGGVEDQKKYSSSIYDNVDYPDKLKFKVKQFSLRNIPSLQTRRYDSNINNMTYELDLAEVSGGSSYLKFFLNFYGCTKYGDLHRIVSGLMELPLVDRYSHYLRIVQYIASSGGGVFDVSSVLSSVKKINNEISDQYLKNLFSDNCVAPGDDFEPYDLYTAGNYRGAVEVCRGQIEDDVLKVHLYEIYVKSCHMLGYESVDILPETLSGKIINDMLGVLSGDEYRASVGHESLLKVCYVFSADSFLAPVVYFSKNEYGFLGQEHEEYFRRFATLNSSSLNPRVMVDTCSDDILLSGLKSVSVDFVKCIKDNNALGIEKLGACDDRKKYYQAKILYQKGDFNASLSLFLDLKSGKSPLYYASSVYYVITILLLCDRYDDCLDFAGGILLDGELSYLRVPISDIFKSIYGESDVQVYGNINLLFLHYYYSVGVSTDRNEEYSDAYDEFMYEYGISLPLEILDKDDLSHKEKVFFLRYVCSPNVIDVSEAYSTNEEVIGDRIQICYTLMDLDSDNSEIYDTEISHLIEKIIIEKSKGQISDGRIYVDTEALKLNLAQDVKEKLIAYHSIVRSGNVRKKYIEHTDLDEELHLPTDEPGLLALNTFEEIRDEFCVNTEYGLNGNVSLEVRHGHIAAQLRQPFEKASLVTERDDRGKYVKNEHLFQSYPIVSSQILTSVDRCLRTFSRQVDELIEEVRGKWLIVDPCEGSFGIDLAEKDLARLEAKIKSGPSEIEFLDYCFDLLWVKTEFNLEEIKSRLTNDLVVRMEECISGLVSSVDQVRNVVHLQDFYDSIHNARNEFHTAVDEVCRWFNRSKRTECPDFEIILPIRIGIETFCSVYGYDRGLFEVEDVATPKPILGEYLNDFVMIFMTLFQNVVKHCPLAEIPNIKIMTNACGNKIEVRVRNKVSLDEIKPSSLDKLEEIEKVLLDGDYSDVVNKEGKTGLYKIDKILKTNLRSGHDFSFGIDGSYFSVDITFNLKELYS